MAAQQNGIDVSEAVPKPMRRRRRRVGKLLVLAVVLGGGGWFGTRVSPDPESLWEKNPGDGGVFQGRHRMPLARMGKVLDNRVVGDLIQVAGAEDVVNKAKAVVADSWFLRRSIRDVVWSWDTSPSDEDSGRFAAVAWVGWRSWVVARALGDVPGGVQEVDGRGSLYF